ncbi:MAG: (Fe-S)-binding protein [Myxococcota bacterium]
MNDRAPTREIFWNVDGEALIYPLALLALGVLGYGIWRRVRLWGVGLPEARFDRPGERLAGLLAEVFGQRRLLRSPYSGIAHLLIFYGFLAALVATSLVAAQEWSGIPFLRGTFYLWFSLLSDAFGLLGIVGLCMAIAARIVRRPSRPRSVSDDWIALGLLLLLFLQGFFLEGLRIAATELRQQPELAPWSPVGYLAALALADVAPGRLRSLHVLHWWMHALTAFAFLGYLAYGKLAHIGYGLLNVFCRSLAPRGRLTHPDIEAALASDPDSLERLGVGRIEQMTWKGLLDLDACMSCGRCDEVCPANLVGLPLQPRAVIRQMRDQLTAPDAPPLLGESAAAVTDAELWACRTCGACQQECPVFVEHVPKIVDMRRHLVMSEARLDPGAQRALQSLDERMHPWPGVQRSREEWFADLDVKLLGRGDTAQTLFWVGCTGALIERNVEVTRATARVLAAGGVDFAVLGAEESCTGDPARRLGDELAFQTCAKRNVETLQRYSVQKIVTGCPHCFNTLKNEYPDFGGSFDVVHHTELIRDLVTSGRLKLRRGADSVTYHDPCYLGRHNGVYEAPRQALSQLSREARVVEVPRNRSRSLCCGAGGGHAWLEDTPEKRVSETRLEELAEAGTDAAAVSCPFCLQMFEDTRGALGAGRELRIADIAELVAEGLE